MEYTQYNAYDDLARFSLKEAPPPRNGPKKRIMTTFKKPDHLENFPCMQPWIGSLYRDSRYKRLLVVAESHYMPEKSTIHHDPDRWYQSNEGQLPMLHRLN